jgi:hypothetical protein
MEYNHTQRAPLDTILYAVAAAHVAAAFGLAQNTYLTLILVGAGILFALAASCFGRLTVLDDGDALTVRYGPLPVFRKRLPYENMTSAKPGRSSLIDGWGVHWVPGRGWTYNLWGFDCVVIEAKGKVFRIGTNDTGNLARFINTRISRTGSTPREA